MIKLRILRERNYPRLSSKWGLKAITGILIREGLRDFEAHRREDDVQTKAEIGLMWPQAKECLTNRSRNWQGMESPLELCGKCDCASTLFWDF